MSSFRLRIDEGSKMKEGKHVFYNNMQMSVTNPGLAAETQSARRERRGLNSIQLSALPPRSLRLCGECLLSHLSGNLYKSAIRNPQSAFVSR
jgi:hypothetical protein